MEDPGSKICSSRCACNNALNRRAFLKASGIGAASLLAAQFGAMAGPFESADFTSLVPVDKKLSPEWIASLFARGVPQTFGGEDLNFIGMPVGGIGAGQVYLAGDGSLWHWDIFNQTIRTGAEHYAAPLEPASPFELKFVMQIGDEKRPIDKTGFSDIRFRGEYPIGTIEYRDAESPIELTREVFSPFIPHNVDDSSIPATVISIRAKNTGTTPIDVKIMGHLENAVCLYSVPTSAVRQNRVLHKDGVSILECAVQKDDQPPPSPLPDVVFEDWSKDTYAGWTVEGEAFGLKPILKTEIPSYQGNVGGDTDHVVNSHASAPNGDVTGKDGATGRLTSAPFIIRHRYIELWIGGGSHKNKTCVNIIVDGAAVRSITGQNKNEMTLQRIDVGCFKDKEARLSIVDTEPGGWGNIGVGKITFTDQPATNTVLDALADFGTMAMALLGPPPEIASPDATAPICDKLVGQLGRAFTVAVGQSVTATFVLAWHFPNLTMDKLPGGRHYATRFASATDVAAYVATNFDRLTSHTKLWRDTWYDSTLPYWFLDRTMLNTSILATSTCYRFRNSRFYGWEGVGCCEGTCGHVWQYAHAPARLFPQLESQTRERIDFGLALQPDGAIHFRGEHNSIPAIDAQAGAILRAYREHQMSPDNAFLRRIWPNVKRATEWLLAKDANNDGIIESNQHNTLDTDWFGPVAWLSGLYGAALHAAERMADEVGEQQFAKRCGEIAAKGEQYLVANLFDGEYFINKPDPQHLDAINSGNGCEIDQVMGQSWAWQVGLGRVLPEKETRSALQSLWRYNFTPDVGPYREANKPGRWYAMPGEAGLLMCTFPRTDWNYDKAKGKGAEWAAGYFNECMNGFEYQAAGHMIWEGLVQEGLAVTRAVHDRYHPSRRNPWNEVECGDHYARSMASYGVYLAACGFEYHGPKGHIGFAPRITPENFKAAFTCAEGWGSFSQTIAGSRHDATIALKWGTLQLQSLTLDSSVQRQNVTAKRGDTVIETKVDSKDGRTHLSFAKPLILQAGETLQVTIG